jgi:membrane fusion protein (multidrug efflux system)
MRDAEMRQVQQKLAALKHELALRTIRSPVTGVVAKKDKQAGEHIEPGQPIYMIVDTTKFWIEAKIEETKIRFVRPGSPAVIYIDSYPGVELSGTVFEVGEATVSAFALFSPAKLTGVFIKSVQRIPVKIRVDNSNGLLKVGMLATVWIKKHSR